MSYSLSTSDADCYPGTTVLVNKLGLKQQEALDEAERVAVSFRSVEILRSEHNNEFSFAYYCSLHEKLFGDIYDWAGKLRTVNLSKKGTSFYSCEKLEECGIRLFQRLAADNYLCGMDRAAFVSAIAGL